MAEHASKSRVPKYPYNAIELPCEECSAEAGQPCTTVSGVELSYEHGKRKERLRRAQRDVRRWAEWASALCGLVP